MTGLIVQVQLKITGPIKWPTLIIIEVICGVINKNPVEIYIILTILLYFFRL